MTDWTAFFPQGASVIALPNWRAPRLLFPAHTPLDRWHGSAFYPAFRWSARLLRLILRIQTLAYAGPVWHVQSVGWPLGDFLRDVLPDTRSVAVLMGTPGPAQKRTVQCRDARHRVIGYLKYAQRPAARRRLAHEHAMLTALPAATGPAVLKYASWLAGEALVTTPLPGAPLPARLPLPPSLVAFTQRLYDAASEQSTGLHPWLTRPRPASLQRDIELLAPRRWPVVLQHGDLAPWNVFRTSDGTLHAFDWEYGSTEGFPFADLVHYTLQVSALIYHWSPKRGAHQAAAVAIHHASGALSDAEAHALVRLAAFDAFHTNEEDGLPADAPLQAWRHAIWSAMR